MTGFTDRSWVGDRAGRHPNAPDPGKELIPLVVEILDTSRALSIQVRLYQPFARREREGDVAPAWLPRALTKIEPGQGAALGRETATIKVPRWLAVEKGLVAWVTEDQGSLF